MSDLNLSSISTIGNRTQILGTNGNFDVQAMLQMEIDIIQLKKQPYLQQKNKLQTEKSAWQSLENRLKSFQNIAQEIKKFDNANKTVSLESEGSMKVTASSQMIDGDYEISIHSVATQQRILGGEVRDEPLGISETIRLNSKEIEVNAEVTPKDIIDIINEGDYGVSAIVLNNKLMLTSKKYGTEGEVEFSNSETFQALGLIDDSGILINELQGAKDAKYTLNGMEMTSSDNTVKPIEGLTIELIKETQGVEKLKIHRSDEEFLEKARQMVKEFNGIMDVLSNLSGERKILQGNLIPRQIKNELTSIISNTTVNGLGLSEYGFSFDRSIGKGFITLDETKLMEKFNQNDDTTVDLLTGENGIADKIENIIEKYVSNSGRINIQKEGLDNRIDRVDKSIERFDINLERQKETLLRKYARLDVMLQQLQQQQDYISAQLGVFHDK